MLGTYSELIRWIVKIQQAQSYLEIGVQFGFTFKEVAKLVKRAIGVDIKNRLSYPCEFYEMTSNEFFKNFHDKIDVIFIDGDHRFEQARKDFESSLKILNNGGTIILHDTDPKSIGRLVSTSCAGSYKLIDYTHRKYPELDIMTFPVGVSGISVVRRKKDRRVLKIIGQDKQREKK